MIINIFYKKVAIRTLTSEKTNNKDIPISKTADLKEEKI